jgi:hypothetical protein
MRVIEAPSLTVLGSHRCGAFEEAVVPSIGPLVECEGGLRAFLRPSGHDLRALGVREGSPESWWCDAGCCGMIPSSPAFAARRSDDATPLRISEEL